MRYKSSILWVLGGSSHGVLEVPKDRTSVMKHHHNCRTRRAVPLRHGSKWSLPQGNSEKRDDKLTDKHLNCQGIIGYPIFGQRHVVVELG